MAALSLPGVPVGEAAKERRLDPGVRPDDCETAVAIGPYSCVQKKRGLGLTADSVFLSDFVSPLDCSETVVDLGAGAGALLFLLAHKTRAASITGIEIQGGLAELAQRNIAANGLSGRLSVINMDLRDSMAAFLEGSFSVAVSNPPYAKMGSGRQSPFHERAASRGEVMARIEDVVVASRHLVGKDGRAFFVFPASRLDDMLAALAKASLRPRRLKFVHPGQGRQARIFLIEAGARGGLKVEDPLFG